MSRQKRVHESLKIRPPPLRQCISDLPVLVYSLARKLRPHGRKALIQPPLETLDFVIIVEEVIAGSAQHPKKVRVNDGRLRRR